MKKFNQLAKKKQEKKNYLALFLAKCKSFFFGKIYR